MHVDIWKEMRSSLAGTFGMLIMAVILILAASAPLIAPSYREIGPVFSPPSGEHILGTDDLGQDIAGKLVHGARTSLMIAIGVAILSALISVVIGGSAAILGGTYDRICMRAVDAVIALPSMIVMILVASYLRPNLGLLIILISLFSWPGGARIVRSQTLSLRERLHVLAARTFGASRRYLLFRHIVPDLSPILVAIMIQDARRAVLMEAGLAFLGVSDPMIVSWGRMMKQAMSFTYLDVWKWWLIPTGVLLSLTLVGLSLIAASLERAMDPRLREDV
ncbi:MAG: ABC transporter permease [Methanothrix sp.]|jgi:peptide/nickel transport system permease protein|uniref:Binding-protein-dependent transport systems inner membrane component n=1 Tax=Methanothrix thermoacetophila (strain DSM 6194 / JCM 14653 / NBRC 101360 / PT) TaxID=349307 RepID=A0B7H2_METTP|nr:MULTISPECIES: ABC transporter permease [Methanothrix]ABK14646.1 binding-protein-dependent transport systems inner membrane component [Methanothrix thermoacetophila PT]MBC7079083.1 ABC transporter permease [Methanothrix sp.]NPU87239.1 ABC transporter permease [Methanothrix sp.]